MGYDPKQPRDEDGQWTKGGGSYGPGQKLKGTANKYSEGSVEARKAALEKSKVYDGDRWSRMPSTAKANLTASAQFATKTKSGKVGKLPTLGKTSPRMQPPAPFKPSEPNVKAVAIQTAKALDRDFHSAKNKADRAANEIAISNYKGPITKLPPGKKPKR